MKFGHMKMMILFAIVVIFSGISRADERMCRLRLMVEGIVYASADQYFGLNGDSDSEDKVVFPTTKNFPSTVLFYSYNSEFDELLFVTTDVDGEIESKSVNQAFGDSMLTVKSSERSGLLMLHCSRTNAQ